MKDLQDQNDTAIKCYQMMRDIEVAMLTTVQANGMMHTRPMVTRFREPRGDLWFFTREDAPKAGEVAREHDVAVAYADPRHQWYVAVSGRAEIVHDRQLQNRLWTPALAAWFPEGVEDERLALLRVKIRTAEYWDAPSSTMIEILLASDGGTANDSGGHGKVNLG